MLLGNLAERFIDRSSFGLAKPAANLVAKSLGYDDCGCDGRREALNRFGQRLGFTGGAPASNRRRRKHCAPGCPHCGGCRREMFGPLDTESSRRWLGGYPCCCASAVSSGALSVGRQCSDCEFFRLFSTGHVFPGSVSIVGVVNRSTTPAPIDCTQLNGTISGNAVLSGGQLAVGGVIHGGPWFVPNDVPPPFFIQYDIYLSLVMSVECTILPGFIFPIVRYGAFANIEGDAYCGATTTISNPFPCVDSYSGSWGNGRAANLCDFRSATISGQISK